MNIAFPTVNLLAIAPPLVVLATALVVILVDLWVDDKRWLSILGLIGVGVAALVGVAFRSSVGSDSLDFQGMARLDGLALVLDLVLALVAGLALLISMDYLDRKGLARGSGWYAPYAVLSW